MNVLSLFNGMSGGMMALEKLGVPVTNYYSSEIDKYANQAAQALFPDTVQLGDVTNWREWGIDWASIDLVTGGFPCQAWSMAGKQLGDKDERGMLFWTMLDIMKHVKYHNPRANFLIENVKMKKEFEEYITTHMCNALNAFEYDHEATGECEYLQEECGKTPLYKILINSALVSAQNRNRYYWTNFEVEQPEDRGILLKDIIEHDGDYTFMSDKFVNRQQGRKCLRDDLDGKAVNLSAMEYVKNGRQGGYIKCGSMIGRKINPETGKRDDYNPELKTVQRIEIRGDEKTGTLTTVQKDNLVIRKKSKTVRSGGRGSYDRHEWDSISDCHYRKLTPRECMRLQTVPEQHIDTLLSAGISNTQLYKMTGNGWTVDVIAHILSFIK
jgi:DNA (cytosine-5)-methyltransferase 1/DNA (cytosine-5)-methyltransferase 3A